MNRLLWEVLSIFGIGGLAVGIGEMMLADPWYWVMLLPLVSLIIVKNVRPRD